MRIVVFLDLPFGGAFRSMEEICKRLTERHQLIFFGSSTQPESKKSRIFADFNSLVIERIKQKQLAKKIDSEKFDVVFITHDRHLQSPWILRYLKTKTVFLCQEPTRAFFEKFLDVDPNLPLPNKIYEKINRYFRKTAEVENAQYATKIIANSSYSVESIFRAYGVTATPVYLGIDKKQFFPKNKKRKKQVLLVGNDEPQKGLRFAIDSISKISKEIRPTLFIASPRLVVNNDLINFAKKKGVKLENKSGLNPSELCDVYNDSLLTLATAYLEPFGLSVIESMACGSPVVAVNEGGFRETVTHNKTGLLIERDPQKIADAITTLIKDSKTYKEIAQQATLHANNHFTWDGTVQKIEEILNETINK